MKRGEEEGEEKEEEEEGREEFEGKGEFDRSGKGERRERAFKSFSEVQIQDLWTISPPIEGQSVLKILKSSSLFNSSKISKNVAPLPFTKKSLR